MVFLLLDLIQVIAESNDILIGDGLVGRKSLIADNTYSMIDVK